MPSTSTRFITMDQADFTSRFGGGDFAGRVCSYTPQVDTRRAHAALPRETPARAGGRHGVGHMTANFTRWTVDDAQIFSMGIVRGMERSAPGAAEQEVDVPTPGDFARFADFFGKAWKAFFIMADSMIYDFGRLAPLDFAFIDGGHDLDHALNDSRKAYDALTPGGWLVWHDFNSPVPWVKVREAIEQLGFGEPVVHVEGTQVAFLRKRAPLPSPRMEVPQPGTVRVAWEGDPEGLHSLGLVNRALRRFAGSRARCWAGLGFKGQWGRDAHAGSARRPLGRAVGTWAARWACPGAHRASVAAAAGTAVARSVGAHATVGVRQPSESLAAGSARC